MNSFPNRPYDQFKISEVLNPYTLTGIDFEKLINEKATDENYYFLLLTIYFYLKNNNYHTTADILFNEANLGKIFSFPQDFTEAKSELDQLKKKFINFFYYNTFFHQSEHSNTIDFLSDFWNQFWDIFVEKIRQNNQSYPALDQYLAKNKLSLTCNL